MVQIQILKDFQRLTCSRETESIRKPFRHEALGAGWTRDSIIQIDEVMAAKKNSDEKPAFSWPMLLVGLYALFVRLQATTTCSLPICFGCMKMYEVPSYRKDQSISFPSLKVSCPANLDHILARFSGPLQNPVNHYNMSIATPTVAFTLQRAPNVGRKRYSSYNAHRDYSTYRQFLSLRSHHQVGPTRSMFDRFM